MRYAAMHCTYSYGEIHFIDSGNYHYMTRIWLERSRSHLILLVFDNHTDMQPPVFGGLLSCIGWIYDSVMELPLLQKVILIGPDEEAFQSGTGDPEKSGVFKQGKTSWDGTYGNSGFCKRTDWKKISLYFH